MRRLLLLFIILIGVCKAVELVQVGDKDERGFTRIDIVTPVDEPISYYEIQKVVWCATASSLKRAFKNEENGGVGCKSPGFMRRTLFSKGSGKIAHYMEVEKRVIYVKRMQIEINEPEDVYLEVTLEKSSPDGEKKSVIVKTVRLEEQTRQAAAMPLETQNISTASMGSYAVILFSLFGIALVAVLALFIKRKKRLSRAEPISTYEFSTPDCESVGAVTQRDREIKENQTLARRLGFFK